MADRRKPKVHYHRNNTSIDRKIPCGIQNKRWSSFRVSSIGWPALHKVTCSRCLAWLKKHPHG